MALGVTIAQSLVAKEIAVVFINDSGEVELCPPLEIYMDNLDEESAISFLLDKEYSDEQLLAYLKGRRTREGIRDKNM